MKVSHFAKVIDNNNKTRFKFPSGTLLDKINDEWTIIIEYYENYFPFAVGNNDGNYRPVKREEFINDKFIKLFSVCRKDERIKRLCKKYVRICIDDYPLCTSSNFQIYFGECGNRFLYLNDGWFHTITNDNKIHIHQDQSNLRGDTKIHLY